MIGHRFFVQRLAWFLPAALVTLLYFQVWDHLYIDLDDFQYTSSNDMVAQGLTLEGLKWAFAGSHVANYHPLTWLSHMLDFSLFGNRPGIFALENAAIHAVNATLVAVLFALLFRSRTVGIAVGLVFAAHPKLVEAVAWISQRKTLLSTLFFLVALLLYFSFREEKSLGKRRALYAGALLAYAASLFSKGMYVTMPAILFLLHIVVDEYRFTSPWSRRFHLGSLAQFSPILPFLAFAAVFSFLNFDAQQDGGAVADAGNYSIIRRLETSLVGLRVYVQHFVFPANLSLFYPISSAWTTVTLLKSAGILVGVTALVVLIRKRLGDGPFLGWLLFVVMLSPVAGIIQIGAQSSADRYMYGPILGLLLTSVTISRWVTAKFATRGMVLLARVGASAWLALASITTYGQVGLWDNSYALTLASLASVGPEPMLLSVQGTILLRVREFEQAREAYEQALALWPEHPVALSNLGLTEGFLGNVDEAIRLTRKAVLNSPKNPGAKINLADFLITKKEAQEALQLLEETKLMTNLNPDHRAKIIRLEAAARLILDTPADNADHSDSAQGKTNPAMPGGIESLPSRLALQSSGIEADPEPR